tara:strand:+ start:341 stop:979 length:639 start_codon:yes stop_codon:yes gene_type:complete
MFDITSRFTKNEKTQLKLHGADWHDFSKIKEFKLDDALVDFKPKIPHFKNRMVNTSSQVETFDALVKKPIKGSQVYAVSSFPTDDRAKLFASNVMCCAIDQFKGMNMKQRAGKGRPYWHHMYGGYRDKLLDGDLSHKPSFIVVSNLTEQSSPLKFEKLRDIMEKFSDVPILVVFGSTLDPVTLMVERIYKRPNHAFFLTENQVVVKSLLELL